MSLPDFARTSASGSTSEASAARDGAEPSATAQYRIASVTKQAFATDAADFVDWLGNPDGSTQYLVTSVDSLGNEGTGPAQRRPMPPTNVQVQ